MILRENKKKNTLLKILLKRIIAKCTQQITK